GDPFLGAVADQRGLAGRLVGVLLRWADGMLAVAGHLGPGAAEQRPLLQGEGEAQQVDGAGEGPAGPVPALGQSRHRELSGDGLALGAGWAGTVVVRDARVGQPPVPGVEAGA